MATRYRKISVSMWTDEKVFEMKPMTKLVMLFLLTHPTMTQIGAIRGNAAGLAWELQVGAKKFQSALEELVRLEVIECDVRHGLIFFPHFLVHNAPENPNAVKSWSGTVENLPECPLLRRALVSAWESLAPRSSAFRDAFLEAFPEFSGTLSEQLPEPLKEPFVEPLHEQLPEQLPLGSPNQEQEQEQEQDILKDKDAPTSFESEPEPEPVVVEFPCVGGKGKGKAPSFGVTQGYIDEQQQTFPAVDILGELKKAKAWVMANPAKRKTARGMPSFLYRWFERAQNSGRSSVPRVGIRPAPDLSAGRQTLLNGRDVLAELRAEGY